MRRWQFLRSVDFERGDGWVECDRVERFGWIGHHWRFQLRRFQRFREHRWLRLRRLGWFRWLRFWHGWLWHGRHWRLRQWWEW